jgi:hypothetical protein
LGCCRACLARICFTANGEVVIDAVDDTGAGKTVSFNSRDLERGNAGRGLPEGVGEGTGNWRLRLTSLLDLEDERSTARIEGIDDAGDSKFERRENTMKTILIAIAIVLATSTTASALCYREVSLGTWHPFRVEGAAVWSVDRSRLGEHTEDSLYTAYTTAHNLCNDNYHINMSVIRASNWNNKQTLANKVAADRRGCQNHFANAYRRYGGKLCK